MRLRFWRRLLTCNLRSSENFNVADTDSPNPVRSDHKR